MIRCSVAPFTREASGSKQHTRRSASTQWSNIASPVIGRPTSLKWKMAWEAYSIDVWGGESLLLGRANGNRPGIRSRSGSWTARDDVCSANLFHVVIRGFAGDH